MLEESARPISVGPERVRLAPSGRLLWRFREYGFQRLHRRRSIVWIRWRPRCRQYAWRMLIYQDLFAYDRRALCHLSLFGTQQHGLVVLVLDPDDNPGPSVVNAAETVLRRIAEVFGQRPGRVFVAYSLHPGEWIEVVHACAGGSVEFVRGVRHDAVETLIAEPFELPPGTSWLAAGLATADHALLGLLLPEEIAANPIDEITTVAVADLPWAHNPSRCAHYQLYTQLEEYYGTDFTSLAAAGAHFFLSLSTEQLSSCRYHDHDWKAIAAASVALLEQIPAGAEPEHVHALAAGLLTDANDRFELECMFLDPIIWVPGSVTITNGQHRTCALKAAGASLCVAAIHDAGAYRANPANARRSAQSTLATYWIARMRQEDSQPKQ
jgi:hypothetical protein